MLTDDARRLRRRPRHAARAAAAGARRGDPRLAVAPQMIAGPVARPAAALPVAMAAPAPGARDRHLQRLLGAGDGRRRCRRRAGSSPASCRAEHAEFARRCFDRSPYGERIELRVGPALETRRRPRGPVRLRLHRRRQGGLRRLLRGGRAQALAARADRGRQHAARRRASPTPTDERRPRDGGLQRPRAGRRAHRERAAQRPRRRDADPRWPSAWPRRSRLAAQCSTPSPRSSRPPSPTSAATAR